jgi:hypothetical protein
MDHFQTEISATYIKFHGQTSSLLYFYDDKVALIWDIHLLRNQEVSDSNLNLDTGCSEIYHCFPQFKLFENRMLRRIYGSKWEEVVGS